MNIRMGCCCEDQSETPDRKSSFGFQYGKKTDAIEVASDLRPIVPFPKVQYFEGSYESNSKRSFKDFSFHYPAKYPSTPIPQFHVLPSYNNPHNGLSTPQRISLRDRRQCHSSQKERLARPKSHQESLSIRPNPTPPKSKPVITTPRIPIPSTTSALQISELILQDTIQR